MHAPQTGLLPAQDAPEEKPPAPAAPTPIVVWVGDGTLSVTTFETPIYVPCGTCRCAACRAHDPEDAMRFL